MFSIIITIIIKSEINYFRNKIKVGACFETRNKTNQTYTINTNKQNKIIKSPKKEANFLTNYDKTNKNNTINNTNNNINNYNTNNDHNNYNTNNDYTNFNQNSNNTNNYCTNNNNNGMKKFTFNGTNKCNFIVHKNDGMNDYIIELTLTKFDKDNLNSNNLNKQTEFIMILDVSGSMSGHVHKLVSDIIPKGLNLLNYSDNFSIHLITFESQVNYYKKTIRELKNDSSLEGCGGTYMANVYEKVKSILNNNNKEINYRILVLSDGIIADQNETMNEAEKIKNFIKDNNYSISVGSIRYNSGSGEPDTRAISSVLRLNTDNTKTKVLTNVSSSDSNEFISRKIYDLFKDDYFESDYLLESDKIKFRIDPWNEGSNKVKLNEGKNIIFADKNPSLENVGIYEGGQLKYTKDDFKNGYKLTYSNYNALLGAKINMTTRKVRINKTSGSKEALEENKKIINYFETFEKNLVGNNNKEAIVAQNLKTTNELDIRNYNNNQLAQFIGVENNMVPITDFLKDCINIDRKDEDNIKDFVGNVFGDGMKIDMIFEKLKF